MKTGKKLFLLFFLSSLCFSCIAQLQPVYVFQKDDTILRKNFYDQSLKKKSLLIATLAKPYAEDYKKIYDAQFTAIAKLWQSTRCVTAPDVNGYLQLILRKIVDANPELKNTDARLVFSRDWWPNAYSMGDGSIAVNAGLVIFLHNEAELAFIVCHELSHYYFDHTNKAIKKYVETVNSESYQKELKRLSKQEYGANKQLEELEKSFTFNNRQHSRTNEAEADRQAFVFMKRAGYDCNGIKTCLEMLNDIDDSLTYKPPVINTLLNLNEYPFKPKWISKESAIFSAMKDSDELTKKEKDSLRTHPDCSARIAFLEDSIKSAPAGSSFLIDEKMFNRLKKDFFMEMTEECYREKNLSRNLYYSLALLQAGENKPMAIYSIARCLNDIYENQKDHHVGTMIDNEGKQYPEQYNLLLRMLSRIRLEEVAALGYYFCKQYQSQMEGYAGFKEEMDKATRNKNSF